MAAQACGLLTYNMITPVVAKYATVEGAALGDAGIVAGAFAVVAIVFRPIGGMMSDRLNRKRVLLATMGLNCLALVGYMIAPDLVVFMVFRIVHGIAYALGSTVASAVVLVLLPEGRQAEGMGYFSWAYVLASACGPALGVIVSDAFGYGVLFALSAAVMFAGTLLIAPLKSLDPPGRDIPEGPIHFHDFLSVKALPFMVIIACFSVNWGCISTFLVMTGDAREVTGIALFFTANAIALLVTRPPAGKIADRYGVASLFYPAVFFETLALVLLAFAHHLWLFLVTAVVKALGQGTVHPSLQVESVKTESPERSGAAMATFLLGTDIGYAIGPIYAGFMCANMGYASMYLACVPFAFAALAIFVIWRMRVRSA